MLHLVPSHLAELPLISNIFCRATNQSWGVTLNNLSPQFWKKFINHIRAHLINRSTSLDRQQPPHNTLTLPPHATSRWVKLCTTVRHASSSLHLKSRTWKQLQTLHVGLYRILIKKPCILFAVTKGNLGVHLNPIRPVLMPQEMRE